MASEGGGVVVPVTNWDVFTEDFWEQWPTADSRRAPDFARQAWVAKNVGWFTKEAWKDPAQRAQLIAEAFRIWQASKFSDPRSKLARHAAKTDAGREFLRQHTARSQGTSTPPATPTRPVTTQQKLVELLRIAAEQYRKFLQQRAAAEQQRAQLRALRQRQQLLTGGSSMPFPSLGFSTGSLGSVVPSGGGGSWLDVLPGLVGAASPLITQLLGEQEASEAPDILERLGMATGLEGAVEREAAFWYPTASGVRPAREIMARNPMTGRLGTWRYMGRPVLYSGDLATCKRVGKIAGRVSRFSGRRGSLRRGRRR
jgi:hypothetical protein